MARSFLDKASVTGRPDPTFGILCGIGSASGL